MQERSANFPFDRKIPKIQYLFRAKCSHGDEKGDLKIDWEYGNLTWFEIQPSPVFAGILKHDPDAYYIISRAPYATADWNMPFPVNRYYIPQSFLYTITQYQGYNDYEGNHIFEGDIVEETYSNDEGTRVVHYIAYNFGFYKDTGTPYEFFEFFDCSKEDDMRKNNLSNVKIIGNIFDGPKPGYSFKFDYEKFKESLET